MVQAVRAACLEELLALKPGNVHVHAVHQAPGPAALLRDFRTSAEVAAVALVDGPPGVGARALRAVEATWRAVGHNTNLGIILLCAVLVEAAFDPAPGDLHARTSRVLDRLGRDDAAAAFRAIALARPAGLGAAPEHDVRDEPTVDLRTAMAAAADRDRIAAAYVDGFAEVFERGVPRLEAACAAGLPHDWAVTAAYLGFLAAAPDSHILRKHGPEAAEAVRARAAELDRTIAADGGDPRTWRTGLLAFDRWLRRAGLNPGTSADLTVATLVAWRLDGADAPPPPSETAFSTLVVLGENEECAMIRA